MPNPVVRYTSKSFDTLKADMLSQIPVLAPAWTNLNEGDLGIALVNLVAGCTDLLAYYLDRYADENFLPSAISRDAVTRLARLIDYRLSRPVAATCTLRFTLPDPAVSPVTIPKYTEARTTAGVYFTTRTDLVIGVGQTTGDVIGYQGRLRNVLFTGTGADEQSFSLVRPKLAQNFLRVFVDATEWTEDSATTPLDIVTVFEIQTDDEEVSSLVFNRFLGAVPAQNATIDVYALETLGAAGNIGSGLATTLVTTVPGQPGITVTNTTLATGGQDRETLDEARLAAPRQLRTLHRVVTLQDYVDQCESTAGVAKAQAINHSGYVECYVAPDAAARFFIPSLPPTSVTGDITGGSLAAGTYHVQLTAVDEYGETGSFEYNPADRAVIDMTRSDDVASGTTGRLDVVVPALPAGATSFNLYCGTSVTSMRKVAGPITPSSTVQVTALPGGGEPLAPTVNTTGVRDETGTKSLRQALEADIEARRMLGTVFALFNPTYVPVAVTATVVVYSNYLQASVQTAVETALEERLSFAQQAFATDLALSDLYQAVMDVEGVRSVSFSAPSGDVTIDDGEIATLGTVTLTMQGGS